MQTVATRPLLDRLAHQLGCGYLSDLKYLDSAKRAELVRLLEATPSTSEPIEQWNDALGYLAGLPAAGDSDSAKTRLIDALDW